MPRVECPRCERILNLPPSLGVRKVRCQVCHEAFVYAPSPHDIDDQVVDWLSENLPPAEDEAESPNPAAIQ